MAEDLRDQTRAALPEAVISLWDKLEHFSDTRLRVEVFPQHLRLDGHGNPAAIMAGHGGATIYLPNEGPASVEAVYHELLHAERLWMEGVPELVLLTADENNWRLVGEIEGDLEHLVIIPRQAAAGLDETDRLRIEARRHWQAYPWSGNEDPWARRKACLVTWLSHHLLDDASVSEIIKQAVIAEGLFREAELFRRKALSLLDRKEDLLACAVRFLRVPEQEVGMRYIDVRSRSSRVVPIRHR